MIEPTNRTENQWKEINRNLQFYKILALLAACSVLASVVISALGAFSNPTVVLKNDTEHCFLNAKRESVEVTDNDIIDFVQRWVVNRYEWSNLNEDELIRNLAPYTSEGLLGKIRDQFKNGAEKEFKEKTIRQDISKNILVSISDNKVTAVFDRILRLNGIPLVDPAQLGFSLVKGTKTRLNPHGIYVNGITEYSARQ